ncbi:hypothetical protein LG634_31225 [Streptomyces bambusae]|uniref:hypothetical protein n=1 Tax=Streptomyces bambusae TaxID=1550616 RepID=UPI001CFFFE91|nr:hypothetical protein [Streptomyces bambusae]MCB5169270.1 hypothetical protein [Streptomyces bambusae]
MFETWGGAGRARGDSTVRTARRARSRARRTALRVWGVLAVGLFLAVGALPAEPAQAAFGCAGRLMKTLPFSTGEVRVYKTRTHACAVTLAKRPGRPQYMMVSIQPRGGVPVPDSGMFSRQAGPVSVSALSRCVFVRGRVGSGSVSSGWILC